MRRYTRLSFAIMISSIAIGRAFGGDSSGIAEIEVDNNLEAFEFQGRVRDTLGNPAPKCSLLVSNQDLFLESQHELKLMTSDTGEFKFRARIHPWQIKAMCIWAESQDGSQVGVFSFGNSHTTPPKLIEISLGAIQTISVTVQEPDGKVVEGARAGILLSRDWRTPIVSVTNAEGRAIFRIPASHRILKTVAWKSGLGLDFRQFRHLDPEPDDLVEIMPNNAVSNVATLTLKGVTPLSIELVDELGHPIGGAYLFPDSFEIGDALSLENTLRLTAFRSAIHARTNDQGVAYVSWWPTWQRSPIRIQAEALGFAKQTAVYDPAKDNGRLRITLARLVTIRGTIRNVRGESEQGITVTANGASGVVEPANAKSWSTCVSNAEGRYELKITPNQIYLITAAGKQLASAPQTGFAVWPGSTAEGRDFLVRRATRVHGLVMNKSTRKPVANQLVYVSQLGRALNEIDDVDLPNREVPRASIRPIHHFQHQSDAQGRFEFFLGDGSFTIYVPHGSTSFKRSTKTEFQIAGESERELNILTPVPAQANE